MNDQSKRPHRITAAQVAAAAGVSRSAVSRAFTPGAYIDDDKRDLILKAALELGYRPNALAASLQGARTNLVGIVAGKRSNPYDGEWIVRLVAELNAADKWPIVLGGNGEATEQDVLSVLRYPLDALIVRGGSVGPEVIENCAKLNIPVILSGRIVAGENIDCVKCRNEEGTQIATDLLLKQGRRRFAYIGGPAGWNSAQERLTGVKTRLAADGLELLAERNSDYSFDGGAAALRDILSERSIDALICGNDAMAMGALSHARHQTTLRVPQDLSIIGFDDIAMANWPEFSLTTLRNPQEDTVREILRLLEARLNDPGKPGEVVWIEPELVPRGTH